METKNCPKCKGKMVKGKVIDYVYIYSRHQRWHKEGQSTSTLFDLGDRKIDSYACEKCGFLEEYLQK